MGRSQMRSSLDREVVARIALVMAIAGAVEFAFFGITISRRFSSLERASTLADLGRLSAALEAEKGSLAEFARDYASWDEARRFVEGSNPAFPLENFNEEWIEVTGLERVAIYSPEASLLWGCRLGEGGYALAGPSTAEAEGLGSRLEALLLAPRGEPWLAFQPGPSGPLLVLAYPVTDSSYTAPPLGWILFGRRLDERMLARISERSGLAVRLSPEEPLARLLPIGEEGLGAAYYDEGPERRLRLPILDAEGRAFLSLEAGRPRPLVKPARELLLEILAFALLATVFASLVLLATLRGLVLRPLRNIAAYLERRAEGEGPAGTLGLGAAAGRRDEIGLLSDRIDALFARLAAERAELRRAQEELERLATIDYLTGLANRRSFALAASREVKRLSRNRRDNRNAGSIAVVLADLDHFKLFNDRYGHQAGDLCLRKVAEAILSGLRRPADLACRFGGEEFILLLPDTDEAGAAVVAENVRLAVEALAIPHDVSPVSDRVSLSLGLAAGSSVSDEAGLEALIARADAALYEAKRGGRNRVRVSPEGGQGPRRPEGEAPQASQHPGVAARPPQRGEPQAS